MEAVRSLVDLAKDEKNLEKLAEGKTKEIYAIKGNDEYVLIRSKDQLTAFNATRKNLIEGKGRIANKTTTNVFQYLQNIGLGTHFIAAVSDTELLAQKCEMIPIEWVSRRVATGSFLKRNAGVKEGYRFSEPKIETFFKDDANDDPQWSDDQILNANFEFSGLKIGGPEIALMKRMTSVIFRVLERAWKLSDCVLVDMKIEFGVTKQGDIVLGDVIDNDSWRVWPCGDKRLQLDKQSYREMSEVTQDALKQLIANYEKVMQLTADFSRPSASRALIVMGSGADHKHGHSISDSCRSLGVTPIMRVSSAHKSTSETLGVVAAYEDSEIPTVIIAVAGRSNGLGPVIAGNSALPVINCPPVGPEWAAMDIWSSLRTPSGLVSERCFNELSGPSCPPQWNSGCSTVLGTDEAALAAAKIIAQKDHMVFGRILTHQLSHYINIYKADAKLQQESRSM